MMLEESVGGQELAGPWCLVGGQVGGAEGGWQLSGTGASSG